MAATTSKGKTLRDIARDCATYGRPVWPHFSRVRWVLHPPGSRKMTGVAGEAAAGPKLVGRYALFDEIACGGMAAVHVGRLVGPVGFSRTVAIKRLHPQFAKDPEFVTMFLDEARLPPPGPHPHPVADPHALGPHGELL